MRLLTYLAFALGLSAAAHAQNAAGLNPVRPMPVPPNANPYGNILYPGGVPSFPTALGANVSGNPPYRGVRPGGYGRPGGGGGGGRGNTVVVPYAVPVYYGTPYDYAPQPASNITVVVPQQPAPSVIINQTFANGEPVHSEWKEYSSANPPEPGGLRVYEPGKREIPQVPDLASAGQRSQAPRSYARDEKATIFLIAMKDSSVRQAIGYWVDGNTLNYVTPDASINKVTLDMVDRDLSVQLNAERKLDFDLRGR